MKLRRAQDRRAGWLPRFSQTRGFSMVEAVIAVVLVSGVLLVAMNVVAASKTQQAKSADRGHAQLLAEELMNEILAHPYADEAASGEFGPGTAEAATGDRSLFDDIDDYHDWDVNAIQRADGTVIPGHEGWKRRVAVTWIEPDDLNDKRVTETGIKRIRISVKRNKAVVYRLYALRTQ